MNHNNYYIKAFTDTEFRNIESYFTNCEVSISKVDGIGEFGEPKNVLLEEYADKREVSVILPPNNEEILYKSTDVTMTILVQGNSNYKVQDQISVFINYISGGIYFKDLARGLGNKLILVGKSINSSELSIANSTAEYQLITLKFKKLFDVDLQVVTSLVNVLDDFDPDMLTFYTNYYPKTITKGFVECGYYFKVQGGVYSKSTTTPYLGSFGMFFQGLTPNTTYLCKPFITTEFETIFGNEITKTTPAS